MKRQTIITILLALVAVAGLAKTKTAEVKADSLLLFVQAGDSCMQQYNTFEALKYYQEAYAIAKKRSQHLTVEQPDLPLDKFDELPEEKQDEIIKHLKRSAENSSIVDCMVQMNLRTASPTKPSASYASAIRSRAIPTPISIGRNSL